METTLNSICHSMVVFVENQYPNILIIVAQLDGLLLESSQLDSSLNSRKEWAPNE